MDEQLLRLAVKARKQIVKFLPEYPETLEGACGVSAYHLMRLANRQGLRPTFVAGIFTDDIGMCGGHCWIDYQNYICDITATQFSTCRPNGKIVKYNPIHVVPATNPFYVFDFRTEDQLEAFDSIQSWTKYSTKLRFLSR